MKGVFITGTDTGIGKTVVSATLCRVMRSRGVNAVVLKPFATGITPETDWRDNDPLLLSAAMDYALAPELISMVRLAAPLSPYDAARINGTSFDAEAVAQATIQAASKVEFAIIEGVGGVAVPLTDDVMVSDFIRMLNLHAVVVGRSRIGTINHTVLTVGCLRNAQVHVEGVVFNRHQAGELAQDEQVGPDTGCRMVRVANFGLVGFSPGLPAAQNLDEAIAALPVNDETIVSLADHFCASLSGSV